MPQVGYITIQGDKQGNITSGGNTKDSVGGLAQAVQPDALQVFEFATGVEVPTDKLSQSPTGQRIHHPAYAKVALGKPFPLIQQAIASGENCTITVTAMRTNASTGQQEAYGEFKYSKAVIVHGEPGWADVQDQARKDVPPHQILRWTFTKVEWKHLVAGTEGSDDWENPVA